jgi:hypothetical protein
VRELRLKRTWDPVIFPEWLVFEVEQGLQIHQEQYDMISHFLALTDDYRDILPSNDTGNIYQLNMGLGKTRVVVPCLILALSKHSKKTSGCMRLYFLSAVLEEAYLYLHHSLSASLLNKKLFVMPFDRNVVLSSSNLIAIHESITSCSLVGGAIILAPEHRLSFILKQQLEWSKEDRALMRDIENVRMIELFDECDEIFSHTRQLVFAMGAQQSLSQLDRRAEILQMILHLLSSSVPRIVSALSITPDQDISEVCCWSSSAKAGMYLNVRLSLNVQTSRAA